MPTLEPERLSLRADEGTVLRVARSFGADAGRYDRARPAYPEALVSAVVAALPGRRVLDVGCGTGIAARQFMVAGCDVLGVDVDARMAEVARSAGLAVEVAAFEEWDPAGRVFDGVVAGQAWHWVDPVAGARRAARALVPGGRLAAFWNVFDPPPGVGEVIAEAYRTAYRHVLGDAGEPPRRSMPGLDVYRAVFDAAASGIDEAGGFGPPEEWRFDWERPYTREEWLDQVPTFGGFQAMPPEVQSALIGAMGAAVDDLGGSFTMRYAAMVVTAQRS